MRSHTACLTCISASSLTRGSGLNPEVPFVEPMGSRAAWLWSVQSFFRGGSSSVALHSAAAACNLKECSGNINHCVCRGMRGLLVQFQRACQWELGNLIRCTSGCWKTPPPPPQMDRVMDQERC